MKAYYDYSMYSMWNLTFITLKISEAFLVEGTCLCMHHILSRHGEVFGLTAWLKWWYVMIFLWHAVFKGYISIINNTSAAFPHLTLDLPQSIFVTMIKGTIELLLVLFSVFDHQIALGFASFCLYTP